MFGMYLNKNEVYEYLQKHRPDPSFCGQDINNFMDALEGDSEFISVEVLLKSAYDWFFIKRKGVTHENNTR